MYVFGGGDAKYWLNDLDMLNLSNQELTIRNAAMDEVRNQRDSSSRKTPTLGCGVWLQNIYIRRRARSVSSAQRFIHS